MEDLDGLIFVGTLEYFDKTRNEIVDSILPELKRRYKVKSGRENMAIAGHSLGGRNALYTA